MDGLEERILELAEQKKSAAAAENYVKAAELKTEIENITTSVDHPEASPVTLRRASGPTPPL